MKKILALLLSVILIMSLAGCGTKNDDDNDKTPDQTAVSYELFSLPGTTKILQAEDTSPYYNSGYSLDIDLAKNEAEGAQLIIRPKQKVSSFDFKVENLLREGGGGVISTSDIEVFAQHYVELIRHTNPSSNRPLGYYPDALVPMSSFVKYKENKIEANKNQGIWITVKTNHDTPAGVYKGNFTLKINGVDKSIPVSVNVWDFDIPDEVNIRSTFNLFEESIMGAQLSNTPETYKTFVDYLLDYRISTTNPVSGRLNDEDWLEQIIEYAKDERVTCYDVFEESRIRLLIENSEPGLNLLEKAFTYVGDEPYDDAVFNIIQQRYNTKVLALISMGNEYEARCDEASCAGGSCKDQANHTSYLENRGLTKADIWGFELLISMSASIKKIEGLRTYCALVSDFDSQGQRDKYAQLRLDADNQFKDEAWWPEFISMFPKKDYATTHWYVCVHPYEPFANYNIDMELAAPRVLSWMQYNYKIDGVLTWGTATYHYNLNIQDTLNGWTSNNVYQEANGAYFGANGDGYLLYPGARYGIDGPIPSLRLMSVRDGFEDYEYIRIFEELFKKNCKTYGINEKQFDSIMQNLYDMLYSGVVPKKDYKLVGEARKMLAEMIELLSSDMKAIIKVNEIDIGSNKAVVDIFATEGTSLKVGTQTYTLSNKKISYTLDLTQSTSLEGTLVKNGIETDISVYVSKPVVAVSTFTDYALDAAKWKVSKAPASYADRDHMFISQNTDARFRIGADGSSMKVDINGRAWTENDKTNYFPSAYISKQDFFGTFKTEEIEYAAFWIYSDADFEIRLDFALEAELAGDTYTYTIGNYFLYKGWNLVKIVDFDAIEWELFNMNAMDYITNVKLEFAIKDHRQNYLIDNTKEANPRDYTFYLDNVYLCKK